MVQRTAKYLPRRINAYVPNNQYDVKMVHEGPFEVVFGPMAVAAAADILSAQSIASAGSTTTLLKTNTDPTPVSSDFPYGPGYGRCLQYVASGAATSTVTVRGADYLGQPMTETITLNGNTPVIGTKAFKYIDSVAWSGTGGTTINVGTTDKLGLPYRMQNVIAEMLDGVRVATLGTLVQPSYVDPQTATTTDPRGTYDPQSTLNGTAILSATFLPNSRPNANGNGGLHGIAHFGG